MTTLLIILSLLLIVVLALLYQSWSQNKTQSADIEALKTSLQERDKRYDEIAARLAQVSKEYTDACNTIISIQAQQEQILQERMNHWVAQEASKIREDALKKQKQVRSGYTSEHFAPFVLPDWQAEDFFRVGGSVDYLVLDGADAVRDKRQNQINKVILLDIKTGKADLNTVQRRIRDAIVAGHVAFATYNMDSQELKLWDAQTQKSGTK